MALVRFRVASRGRVELHEVEGPDIDIGRDESCTLVVHHASVAARHARVLLRRGRLILADLGVAKTGTTRGRERLLAPVTLAPGEQFALGDVGLSASMVDDRDRGLKGSVARGLEVLAELDSADPGARRYAVALESGGHGELVIERRDLAPTSATEWRANLRASSSEDEHRLPRLLATGSIDGCAYAVESLPIGIRLAALLDGVERRAVHLPVEATIVIVAHLAESVSAMNGAWGAHGAIDPRSVHLGIDGSVWLLRPGPRAREPSSVPDDFLAPERRFGLIPSAASDAFSLGILGKKVLFHRNDCPMRIRAICCWLAHANPARRPKDLAEVASELRSAAQGAELDPTFGHVARAVRLLAPNFARRLCTVHSSSGSSPEHMTV